MRIAIVLDRFDPQHGGLEYWAFQLATWLVEQDNEVHIVAAAIGPDTGDLPFIMHAVGTAPTRVALAERFEQYLKHLPVDLIHDLGSGWYYDVLQPQFGTKHADLRGNLRSLSWLRSLKYLWKRDHRSRLRDACELERRQYAQSHGRIIAVSRMTFADLQQFQRVPDNRMTVIHNGVDADLFSFERWKSHRKAIRQQFAIDDKVVLLFPAHNARLKGLEAVLRAMSRLNNPRLHLLVTGREPIVKWSRLAKGLNVLGQIQFCGFVPRIQPYYAAADAFVQPTFYDPCGLATLEAASFGLPVITSRFNGAAEQFEHQKNGWIMQNPRDAIELADYLRALLNDNTRQHVAATARELALANTADHCFLQIFQVYQSIKSGRRQRNLLEPSIHL